ncbi:MAG TPA: Fe2+-dependent dioxygenase [Polyangia bacterium]|nr:Fe2+-dependent dioxygenase [Polyangia bacterium]
MSAIVLAGVIPPDVLGEVRARLATGSFVSGKLSAVGRAVAIKDNLLLAPASPAAVEATDLLARALQASPAFQVAAWPDAMLRPQLCRYEVGMTYGDHVDAAVMGQPPESIRCDVAITVCLNDGSEYDGGELIIDSVGLPRSWKGRAGDAIVYPADTVHRVTPVTRGVREVAVSWIQSLVREPERRRILFDLRHALDGLDGASPPPPETEAIRRSYFNLIRMWA